MVYTIEEICERIRGVAKRYDIPKIYLFGAYARGEATEDSDVDLLIDARNVHGLKYFGLWEDLEEALEKDVDLLTLAQLEKNRSIPLNKRFAEEVELDKRVIYE